MIGVKREKILIPVILGLLTALSLAGVYAFAHTSEETAGNMPASPYRGYGMGYGNMMHMGMGMMGQYQPMMQGPGEVQASYQGFHSGPRGPFAGFGSGGVRGGLTTVTGVVKEVEGGHHSILIDTQQGLVEVMVPGFWVNSEGETLPWYVLLDSVNPGDTLTADVLSMPCGEAVAFRLSVDGVVYESTMMAS